MNRTVDNMKNFKRDNLDKEDYPEGSFQEKNWDQKMDEKVDVVQEKAKEAKWDFWKIFTNPFGDGD